MLSSETTLFENSTWLTTIEAAIYLRKFTQEGKPSVGAIRTAVCRGQIKVRKWRRRLYFNKAELDLMLEGNVPYKKGARNGRY